MVKEERGVRRGEVQAWTDSELAAYEKISIVVVGEALHDEWSHSFQRENNLSS